MCCCWYRRGAQATTRDHNQPTQRHRGDPVGDVDAALCLCVSLLCFISLAYYKNIVITSKCQRRMIFHWTRSLQLWLRKQNKRKRWAIILWMWSMLTANVDNSNSNNFLCFTDRQRTLIQWDHCFKFALEMHYIWFQAKWGFGGYNHIIC